MVDFETSHFCKKKFFAKLKYLTQVLKCSRTRLGKFKGSFIGHEINRHSKIVFFRFVIFRRDEKYCKKRIEARYIFTFCGLERKEQDNWRSLCWSSLAKFETFVFHFFCFTDFVTFPILLCKLLSQSLSQTNVFKWHHWKNHNWLLEQKLSHRFFDVMVFWWTTSVNVNVWRANITPNSSKGVKILKQKQQINLAISMTFG